LKAEEFLPAFIGFYRVRETHATIQDAARNRTRPIRSIALVLQPFQKATHFFFS
jgi:hypothetical protein